MGRVKLKIKRLESTSNRQVTYSKRRCGILKKAKELSILCDIDIILLMFSPTGKPTVFHRETSNVDEIIAKFAQLTPQERSKRKLESLEALRKTFKKLDHDINIQDFLGPRTQSVEELSNNVRMLQTQLTEVHKRLSFWGNPDKINDIEHLRQMEDSLRESLEQIHIHKEENFGSNQLMPLDCTSQFHNGMHLPLMIGGTQEAQTLSWFPNNENEHMILPEPNFLPQRDMECSRDVSLPSYTGFFDAGKTDTDNGERGNDSRQEGGALKDLSSTECLRLQPNNQYPYHSFSTINLPGTTQFKLGTEVSWQENPLDYQNNGNFELSRPPYNDEHHAWFPASGPCGITMFNETHTHSNQLNCND